MELHQTELKQLSTSRLLTLYRAKRKRRNSMYARVTDYGVYPEILQQIDEAEVTACIRIDKYCDRIKSILNARENMRK